MKSRRSVLPVIALLLLASTSLIAQPDVIVGDITGPTNYTPNAADTGFDAFSLGTTSCNIGTSNLTWISSISLKSTPITKARSLNGPRKRIRSFHLRL